MASGSIFLLLDSVMRIRRRGFSHKSTAILTSTVGMADGTLFLLPNHYLSENIDDCTGRTGVYYEFARGGCLCRPRINCSTTGEFGSSLERRVRYLPKGLTKTAKQLAKVQKKNGWRNGGLNPGPSRYLQWLKQTANSTRYHCAISPVDVGDPLVRI